MLAARSTSLLARAAGAPAFRRLKVNTGISGLEVEPQAKAVLTSLYSKTLAEITKIPESAEYRKAVEKMTKERLEVVNGTDDIPTIEASIGGGQVEQLIQQAKDELGLIPVLLSARAFDAYDGSPVDEIYTDLKR